MTDYRTETSPDTVVCGRCGEHVERGETTFTNEGDLVCRRCAATAAIAPAVPPAVVVEVRRATREHRSWGDFALGAVVPLPLYGVMWAALLALLTVADGSDIQVAALGGAALLWPFGIGASIAVARLRFGRVSFANGLLASALVTLALGATIAVLFVMAMAGAIRG